MAWLSSELKERLNAAMSTATTKFNPPPASEMVDTPSGLPDPYHLKRQVTQAHRVYKRGYKRFGPSSDSATSYSRYFMACSRKRCPEDIEVQRVVAGVHTEPLYPHGEGKPVVHTRQVDDVVYYWPDTALVVETGNAFLHRVLQIGFCSYKCLSLWSAAVDRQKD